MAKLLKQSTILTSYFSPWGVLALCLAGYLPIFLLINKIISYMRIIKFYYSII